MRTFAGALRAAAGQVSAAGAEISDTTCQLLFVGPAADAFRLEANRSSGTVSSAAAELLDLAALVDRAADEVEAERRILQQRLERIREESARSAG